MASYEYKRNRTSSQNGQPYFDWTDERTEKLRVMLAEGKTATEAAATLGVTRNMAMGKAHRKGFPMNATNRGGWDDKRRREAREVRMNNVKARAERKNPIVPPLKTKPKSPRDHNQTGRHLRGPTIPMPTSRPTQAPPSLRLTLLEIRDNDCHFIEGERPYAYCGHPAIELRPYCRFHAALVYQPLRPRST